MRSVPALNDLATKAFDDSTTYGDRVHFVLVYVIEPHPRTPDVSPYTGIVWEDKEYSTQRQPRTYEARVSNASEVAPLLGSELLLLIDDLTPWERDNPLWCTYGPAPNSTYLIRQDGILEVVQTWADIPAMEGAINKLLGREE